LNSPFCAQHSRSADGRRNCEADVQVTGRDRLLLGGSPTFAVKGARTFAPILHILHRLLKLLGPKSMFAAPEIQGFGWRSL
jgi:hypothetical protein